MRKGSFLGHFKDLLVLEIMDKGCILSMESSNMGVVSRKPAMHLYWHRQNAWLDGRGGGLSSMYMWYILYYLEGRPLINMLYRRRFAANMDFLVSWKMGIKCSNLVCGKGGKFTFWVILVFTWKGGKLLKISLEKGSFQFSERWWNTFFHDSASTWGNVNSLWM